MLRQYTDASGFSTGWNAPCEDSLKVCCHKNFINESQQPIDTCRDLFGFTYVFDFSDFLYVDTRQALHTGANPSKSK